MEALGMVELNSIAQGIVVVDAMLKSANVHIVKTQPVCPGKYVIIVSGGIGDVNAAVAQGTTAGGMNVIDSIVIPRVHESVMPAITGCVSLKGVDALGIVETFSMAQAIVSADQAAKAADVALMEVRLGVGLGGKAFVLMTGSVSSVNAAVAAATEVRGNETMILNTAVIPSPSEELADALQ